MEVKRCPRCGNFYNTESNVCSDCYNLEMQDAKKLENVIDFENITYDQFTNDENLVKYAGLAGVSYNVAKRCSNYLKEKFSEDESNLTTNNIDELKNSGITL